MVMWSWGGGVRARRGGRSVCDWWREGLILSPDNRHQSANHLTLKKLLLLCYKSTHYIYATTIKIFCVTNSMWYFIHGDYNTCCLKEISVSNRYYLTPIFGEESDEQAFWKKGSDKVYLVTSEIQLGHPWDSSMSDKTSYQGGSGTSSQKIWVVEGEEW